MPPQRNHSSSARTTDATMLYEIPALERGEYFFRCDVHPDMIGTLVVEG